LFKEQLLITHKMALQSSRAGYYVIVPPSEQSDFAVRTLLFEIEKATKKAKKVIDNTNVDLLSDNELRVRSDASARVGSVHVLSKSTLKPARKIHALP